MILLVQNINFYNLNLAQHISNMVNFTTLGHFMLQNYTTHQDGITNVQIKITKNGVDAKEEFEKQYSQNLDQIYQKVSPKKVISYNFLWNTNFDDKISEVIETAQSMPNTILVVCASMNAEHISKIIEKIGKKYVYVMNLIRNPIVLMQVEQNLTDLDESPNLEELFEPTNVFIENALSLQRSNYQPIKFEDICTNFTYKLGDKKINFNDLTQLGQGGITNIETNNSILNSQEISIVEDYFKNFFYKRENKFVNVMREFGYEK